MRWKRWLVWALLVSTLGGLAGVLVWLFFVVKILELPNFTPFLEYRPLQTAYFYDRSGNRIGCIAGEFKEYSEVVTPPNPQSPLIVRAILEVEDRRFYHRNLSIDLKAMFRAIYANAKTLKIVEGGSTIPQQLVKQLLPPEEQSQKTLARKVKEFFMAWRLLRSFDKDKILTLYVNEIYFGHNTRGIEAASLLYFNKRAGELTPSEAATLVGIIKSPEILSPKKHPSTALTRRNVVLEKIFMARLITKDEYETARREPIITTKDFEISCGLAPHAVDHARSFLKKELGIFFDNEKKNEAWFGLRVTTTIDIELQTYFQEGVIDALEKYRTRHGENAVDVDAAALALDNTTGGILALIGSADYETNQRNNAMNALRQPGSAFKPIVYAALFEEELSLGRPKEALLDLPVANTRIKCRMISNPVRPEDWWEPKNFDEEKYNKGAYSRRFAIAKSINRPAIHSARAAGCRLHPRVIGMAERLGMTDNIPSFLSSALGASETTLSKLVTAYSVFANQGLLRERYLVERVEDSSKKRLYAHTGTNAKQILTPELASLMTEALRGTVQFGTATSLMELKRPLAVKTGTTNDYADAWLIGYDPEISFGGWIGKKEGRHSLGEKETGAQAALPIVKYALEKWYKDKDISPFVDEIPEWNMIIKNPRMFEKELQDVEP